MPSLPGSESETPRIPFNTHKEGMPRRRASGSAYRSVYNPLFLLYYSLPIMRSNLRRLLHEMHEAVHLSLAHRLDGGGRAARGRVAQMHFDISCCTLPCMFMPAPWMTRIFMFCLLQVGLVACPRKVFTPRLAADTNTSGSR